MGEKSKEIKNNDGLTPLELAQKMVAAGTTFPEHEEFMAQLQPEVEGPPPEAPEPGTVSEWMAAGAPKRLGDN